MIVLLPLSFLAVIYFVWKSSGEVHVEDALSDATMRDGSVARTPFELFHDHAKAVEETVEMMLEAVNVAASGEDASKEIEATIVAELSADKLKNGLRF